jgi:hypothetical protein
MNFEQPSKPAPEEIAKIEKGRAISDAELLKNGAEYKINEKGEKRLDATDEQIEEARKEFIKEEIKDGLENSHSFVPLMMDKFSKEDISLILEALQDEQKNTINEKWQKLEEIDKSEKQRELEESKTGFFDATKSERPYWEGVYRLKENKINFEMGNIPLHLETGFNMGDITNVPSHKGEWRIRDFDPYEKVVVLESEETEDEKKYSGIEDQLTLNLEDFKKLMGINSKEKVKIDSDKETTDSDKILGKDSQSLNSEELRQQQEQKYQKFNALNDQIHSDNDTSRLYSLLMGKVHKVRPENRDGKYGYHLLENFLEKTSTMDDFEQFIKKEGIDDGMGGKAVRKFESIVYKGEYSKRIFENAMPNAKSFSELSAVINEAGGIQGSQDFFSAKQLLDIIQKVRNGELKSTAITRTGGLRQKVEDLITIEKHRKTIQNI